MKILFVCGGNSKHFKIASFIKSQGDSLQEEGVDVTYFLIKGKGAINYLKNAKRLRKFLSENHFDVIHAHYSLCGWVSVLAMSGKPVVLSLMGSDAVLHPKGINIKSRLLLLSSLMIQPFCKAIISKSPNIEAAVFRKKISYLVPNGVKLDQFNNELDGEALRAKLGFEKNKKYVLFLGNPADKNKNVALVERAVQKINRPDVVLLKPYRIEHSKVQEYLHAVDVFVMSSFREGSSNVVKEAMSCSLPMVATDVGDTAWLFGKTVGCYIGLFDAGNYAEQLIHALDFSEKNKKTKGHDRIVELGLDIQSVAQKIISIYKKVLQVDEKIVVQNN